MVTTWLDQNKAFRQALFSAKLVFLKQLRAKERFFFGGGGSKTFICLPFGDWIDGEKNIRDVQSSEMQMLLMV